ncbi:unnamed protein product [Closterium sp. Naga37s-1]|nr:unnamed protein product [Closterium sp. Naga37s-1]
MACHPAHLIEPVIGPESGQRAPFFSPSTFRAAYLSPHFPSLSPHPSPPQGRAALSGFTRLSKGLAAVLLMGYVVSLLPSAHTAFALLPGRQVPPAQASAARTGKLHGPSCHTRASSHQASPLPQPSPPPSLAVMLSSSPPHSPPLVLDVVALLFLGRVLEPVWGSREFLRFVLIVSTLTTVCTFIAMVTAYYFTFQGYFLYEPISGFHGVVAGLLVGVKQLMPEQDITVAYVLKFRAKWLPSLFVLLTVVLCFCIGHYRQLLPFILFGTYTSWAYLRFFQPKGDSGLKGDPTDDFAFENFFPEALRPVVGTVATILGRLLCGRRVDRAAVVDEDELLAAGKPLPGSDPVEASRRRGRWGQGQVRSGAGAVRGRCGQGQVGSGAGGLSSVSLLVLFSTSPSVPTTYFEKRLSEDRYELPVFVGDPASILTPTSIFVRWSPPPVTHRERGARALEERLAKAAEAAAAGAAGAGGSAASGAAAAGAPSAVTTGASLGPTERSASSGNLADKV